MDLHSKNTKTEKNNKNLILLAGKAASGKSTVAEIFKKKGYYIISTDEIIRNKLIPKYKTKIDPALLFSVQMKTNQKYLIDNTVWLEAQKDFNKILKKDVKKHLNGINKKVLVEGQLTIPSIIRDVFGDNDNFTLYVVRPSSLKVYIDRLSSRVMNEPDQYGRLVWIGMKNENFEAKNNLLKNGKNSKIWKEFITKIAKEKYPNHIKLYDTYKKNFKPIKYIN